MRSSAVRSAEDAVVPPGSAMTCPPAALTVKPSPSSVQRVIGAREQQPLLHARVDDREDAELVAAHPVRAGASGARVAQPGAEALEERVARPGGRSGRCSP